MFFFFLNTKTCSLFSRGYYSILFSFLTNKNFINSYRRRQDVDVIDEGREETALQNGTTGNHTVTNGVEVNNGFSCEAVSQESLNGTTGRLEFHSDMDEQRMSTVSVLLCTTLVQNISIVIVI